ncbi:CinA family protein [Acholeplasma hippikon]|uniref:CinA family protein n=1 Tax=Acholeplasma hippikon TaxID=264636 RepID=UPI0013C2F02B|nr:CinA family protein [Acholeplasma hippikon]
MIEKNEKIAFAESITGGALSSQFIKNKNASKALDVSYIVYSNEKKIEVLGVDEKLIEKYTVVSEEVAYDMAKKLQMLTKVDLAVSTTGYASGNYELVCFVGIMYKSEIKVYKIVLDRKKSRIKNINFLTKEISKLLNQTIA